MAWLSPHEFSVASLADAPSEGLSFLMPRTKYEQPMLVSGLAGTKLAIFLGTEHRFHSFECATAHNWNGLLAVGVSIEIDTASIFDARHETAPPGALVREGAVLNIAAHFRDGHGFDRVQRVPLIADLTACAGEESAGFRSWRIVLGEGEEKRELLAIELAEQVEG